MPTFIELRPDYPLILTLLEHAYRCALTWFYIAGFTWARTIPFPLIRQNYPVTVSLCTGPALTSALPQAPHRQANPLGDLRRHMRGFASSSLMQTRKRCPPLDTPAQLCAAAVNSISTSRQLLCRLNQQSLRLSQSHAVARLSQSESEERSVLGSAGNR